MLQRPIARRSFPKSPRHTRPIPAVRALAVLATSPLGVGASAATVTWDGGGDGISWNSAGNWSGDAVPGPGDSVVVPAAFAAVNIRHAGVNTWIASFDGYRLWMESGTFAVDGSCIVRSRFTYSGGTVPGAVTLSNATLVPAGGTSPVLFKARGSCTLEGVLPAAQVLSVEGSNSNGTATLTIPPGSANEGTIVLQSFDSTWESRITVASGSSLVNRGSIEVFPGSGGGRSIHGDVRNEGILAVNAVGIVHDGNLLNLGDVAVGKGGVLLLSQAADRTVEQQAGSIGGSGLVRIDQGTFLVSGGELAAPVEVRGVSIGIGSGLQGTAEVIAGGSCSLLGNAAPDCEIWVRGSNGPGTATLTPVPEAVNEGTIRLESINSTWSSRIEIPAGQVLTNRGQIEVHPGSGGERRIAGTLRNEGTLSVGPGATLDTYGDLVNLGDVITSPQSTLVLHQAATGLVQQVSGSMQGPGPIRILSGSFEVLGGQLLTPIEVTGAAIEVGSGLVGGAQVIAMGACSLVGNAAPGCEVWVRGSNGPGTATLTPVPDAENEGTLRLQSINSTWSSRIEIPAGQVLTNRGTIEIRPGSGGERRIAGSLRNEGALLVGSGATLDKIGDLVNVGTITAESQAALMLYQTAIGRVEQLAGSMAGPGLIRMMSGTLSLVGGSLFGPVEVQGGAIHVGAGLAAPAQVIAGGACLLVGNDAAGCEIWVRGSNGPGTATLTVGPDAVNEGSIRLESINSTWTARLEIPDGEVFPNRGTIETRPGTGGERRVIGGGTLLNEGVIAPGVQAPLLVSSGFTQAPIGTLRMRFDGVTAGSWSRLQVGGTAALAGSLEVVRGATFAPPPGTLLVCLSAGSITGTFANAGGCGVEVEVVQTATAVACLFGAPCVGDLNLDGEVSAADLTILLGGWGPCENPSVCAGDLDCDGAVDAADLTILLGAWGPCPG